MGPLSAFGLFAVTAMLVCYALEDRSPWYILGFAVACALGSIYGVAPDVVAKAAEYFRAQLRHVEVALRDGRTFLMGDQFTSADILLTTCLDWAIGYGVGICDNAHPYRDRIHERAAYQQGKKANQPLAPVAPAPSSLPSS